MLSHVLVFLRTVALAAAAVASVAGIACAKGTLTIQQSNGTINTYPNVTIKVIHNALYLTSADGEGTLIINRAACSYQGQILACLPTSVALVQAGATSPVDLTTGTVYVNTTDTDQQLVLSSRKLQPHSILLSFTTKKGTYVNSTGRIDQVVK
jgi:hypothetical protein